MNVKGTTDNLPNKEIIRRKVVNILTNTFENYGYLPLDTSILCYYDLLASKYSGGSEILKEVYKLNDQGDRTLGLRYDLTVPFSKVISMNANKNITLPFKRYEVGKVFRDGPVKTGRAREFYQCDVDVCGIDGQFIEAEMLMMTIECYKKLGIDVYVEINNRKLLEGLIISVGIDRDITSNVILSVDKLAKIGVDGVKEELKELNIEEEKLDKLFELFKCNIEELDETNINNESFIEGMSEIKELFTYIKGLHLEDNAIFTPYLARGLEIYTGTVWEVFDKQKRLTCAIGGGGRYDKIITNFIDDGNSYPAVGISFGLVPICELLEDYMVNSYDLLIIPLDTNVESLQLAGKLRSNDIKVIIEMNKRKVKKALESADKNKIPYVIVLGENEVKTREIEIKDMNNSTNIKVNIDDIDKIVNIIKK